MYACVEHYMHGANMHGANMHVLSTSYMHGANMHVLNTTCMGLTCMCRALHAIHAWGYITCMCRALHAWVSFEIIQLFALKVAKDLNLNEVSQTWLILKLLYCGEDPDCSLMGLIDTTPPSRAANSSRMSNAQTVSHLQKRGGSFTVL